MTFFVYPQICFDASCIVVSVRILPLLILLQMQISILSIFDCLPCFKQRRRQDKSPSIHNLDPEDSKSPSSTTDSSDSDPETSSAEILSGLPIEEPEPELLQTSKLNRALTVSAKHTYTIIDNHPFPLLETEDEIILSTKAVGLNPIDWKSVDYNFCLPSFPWVIGREMAGVVESFGKNVKNFKVGDRVWTSELLPFGMLGGINKVGTYYRDSRAGCFQQYIVVPQHTVCHIPAGLSFESAACLGVAGLTAAMTLRKWLQICAPIENYSNPEYLLVWGGSSVTAQFAIQIAKQSGVNVIAVASSKTRDLVERLGARHVVVRDNKNGNEIVKEIRNIAGNEVTRAIDLVGSETAQYCLDALSTEKSCLFAPLAMISSKASVPSNITIETVEMKQFVLDPASKIYAMELERFIAEGSVNLPSIDVLEGGLESIQMGLERLKKGDMQGRKLVVSFA
jgi:NADPH:quinone reductase-like Zn-dependent oxidoreductase